MTLLKWLCAFLKLTIAFSFFVWFCFCMVSFIKSLYLHLGYRYKVFLVDEFRTSCRCFKCHGECEKCMTIPDPRPFKDASLRLVHGLLSCKNCLGFWNRDCNGASNICGISLNVVLGLERPDYLKRTNQTTT